MRQPAERAEGDDVAGSGGEYAARNGDDGAAEVWGLGDGDREVADSRVPRLGFMQLYVATSAAGSY